MEQLKAIEVYREYWYRWVILTLFVLVSVAGGITNTTCSPITDQVSNIYGISILWVQMNSMVYEFAYIILVFPCNYIADKYELSFSVLFPQVKASAGLTLFGSVLRCAAYWSSWPILIGNAFVAAGVVIGGGCTAKVAAFWFRPEWVIATQRTNATMIASLANNVGAAVGVLIPPFFVKSSSLMELEYLLIFEAVISVVFCGATLVLMKNKPLTPPSPTGATKREEFLPALKSVMVNTSFVMMLVMMAMSMGVYNIFITVIQVVIDSYGFTSVLRM